MVMGIILGEINLKPGYYSRNARFGMLADGVFILPVAIAMF